MNEEDKIILNEELEPEEALVQGVKMCEEIIPMVRDGKFSALMTVGIYAGSADKYIAGYGDPDIIPEMLEEAAAYYRELRSMN